MALFSVGERFMVGGRALVRQPVILVLASCASAVLIFLRLSSTPATMSGTGILFGAGAKFRPLASALFSAVDRSLGGMLTTHLSLDHMLQTTPHTTAGTDKIEGHNPIGTENCCCLQDPLRNVQ